MKRYLPLQLILNSFLTTALAQASSPYCEIGWSLELRKGKDICYKYDKALDKRYESVAHAPQDNNKWKRIVDNEGYRDTWVKLK